MPLSPAFDLCTFVDQSSVVAESASERQYKNSFPVGTTYYFLTNATTLSLRFWVQLFSN